MRMLFVVQRYGEEVAGGAEYLVRELVVRLAERGHQVEVLTSCAQSYADWADVYDAGSFDERGVRVHRLPVVAPRDNELFAPLHRRVTTAEGEGRRLSPAVSEAWSRMIGPQLDGYVDWLRANAARFDVVVFSGYLYTPSTHGLPAVSALVPTVLYPTAHDELTLRLAPMRELFDHAAGLYFLTQEEADLVHQRFRPPGVARVVGAGVNPLPDDLPGDALERFGLERGGYLVCVGRIDPAKGMHELAGYFRAYRERHGSSLRLVFVGSEVHPLERHDDIVVTGFVDDPTKWALVAGAAALVQPSYFESFSLVLTEAWRCGVPALVQGRNDVLAGQVRRSGGGLAYTSFAEFDAALDLLLGSPDNRDRYGVRGRQYVERYNWASILPSFEALLEDTRSAWHATSA